MDKIKGLLLNLKTWLLKPIKDHIWFVYLMGALFLVLKYKDLLYEYLNYSSAKSEKKTLAKDQELKSNEDQAKQNANDLMKDVDKLDESKKPVDENWNKN